MRYISTVLISAQTLFHVCSPSPPRPTPLLGACGQVTQPHNTTRTHAHNTMRYTHNHIHIINNTLTLTHTHTVVHDGMPAHAGACRSSTRRPCTAAGDVLPAGRLCIRCRVKSTAHAGGCQGAADTCSAARPSATSTTFNKCAVPRCVCLCACVAAIVCLVHSVAAALLYCLPLLLYCLRCCTASAAVLPLLL